MSTFTVIIAVLSTLWASSVGLLHGLILSYPPLLSTPSLERPTLNCHCSPRTCECRRLTPSPRFPPTYSRPKRGGFGR
ncbi:hypothetical protein CABS01_11387 [Colletotrichum abscissum]|uniref:uncharacterized protein n=1 Tax=Colletotrichum abscissum TaxID=1671311 RepID=UPI0027D502FB|nr:uncharacterized protein CABS01_11387 [Colletotrichum abscissum]KAK1494371.1 hypothetical protein CABS01_11387 [Colletotrichum abscissum]